MNNDEKSNQQLVYSDIQMKTVTSKVLIHLYTSVFKMHF